MCAYTWGCLGTNQVNLLFQSSVNSSWGIPKLKFFGPILACQQVQWYLLLLQFLWCSFQRYPVSFTTTLPNPVAANTKHVGTAIPYSMICATTSARHVGLGGVFGNWA